MNILCRLGMHDWEYAPYSARVFTGSTFSYRRCRRCFRKEEIYEGLAGGLIKGVSEIPEKYWTGKEEEK